MAFFSSEFLEQVLNRIDLVDLIARHVELKRSGNSMFGLCPFHNEKNPSFSVSTDKQMFYCFGCGKGGSAFQFLMEHDGYSFPEAVEYLADKAGIPLPERTAKQQHQALQQAQQRKVAGSLLQRVTTEFVEQLHQPTAAEALAYLRHRSLPENIIQRYQLGFAPSGYGFLQRRFQQQDLHPLEAQGLLFKGDRGFVDRFRDRVMFPIQDQRGTVVGFGGRLIADGKPKYLNSPETDWFHKSELLYGMFEHRDTIRQRKQLLVVEGYMDVLALAAHDLPIAVAPLGTAIGEHQLRLLFRMHDAPTFSFDGDRAGYQAAWRALERMLPLLKAELKPQFLYLPEGEDPDSLLQTEGGERFMERVQQQAKPILETWLLGLRKLAGQGAEGHARMAKKAADMLKKIQDPYLRQAWQRAAEEKTGVRIHAAREQRQAAVTPRRKPTNRLQDQFMAGLLQDPTRFQRLPEDACNFILDDEGVDLLYSRALSLGSFEKSSDGGRAAYLQSMFPDDLRIPRWINQESISDTEFSSIALDMQRTYLERVRSDTSDMGEKMHIQQRLRQLLDEQKKIRETLELERNQQQSSDNNS